MILHDRIIDLLCASDPDLLSSLDRDAIKRYIFHNYYPNSSSMRLSYQGLQALEKQFPDGKFRFEYEKEELLSGSVLHMLSKMCKMPFYVGKTYLVLFESELAVLFKLTDNDIRQVYEMIKP